MAETVRFEGDDQRSIELRVNGYSWADSEETAELLSITVRVEASPFSGALTVDAGIAELENFRRALEHLLSDGRGEASFETWERDLELTVSLDDWGRVRVTAKLQALEYVLEGPRVTGVLSGTVFTEPRSVEGSLLQLQDLALMEPRAQHAAPLQKGAT